MSVDFKGHIKADCSRKAQSPPGRGDWRGDLKKKKNHEKMNHGAGGRGEATAGERDWRGGQYGRTVQATARCAVSKGMSIAREFSMQDHEVNMIRSDEEYLALLAGEEPSFGREQDGKHERPSV